jgi:ubiquinone/menaquinone biosynthesis C-methylase UbiE
MSRWNFYKQNFLKNINKNEKFLLISASIHEIQILRNLGYTNFAITYHDEKEKENLQNYGFEINKNLFKADVRNLKFENQSFEYVITNATLHHVDQPHKAITEMYRVAKKGVLIIESNDSLTMQIACKLKFAEEFEVSSIDLKNNSGGLLDTGIPNYVYRWNEREIIKTIKSYDPSNIVNVKFNYANDLTNIKLNKLYIKILKIFVKIYFFIFKKQQNCLSIFIDKTKTKKRFG